VLVLVVVTAAEFRFWFGLPVAVAGGRWNLL
jgi:hypothetical protein